MSLSGAATAYLADLLSMDTLRGRPVVRIARRRGSWSVRLDRLRTDDEVVEHDGQPLVAYTSELSPVLEGALIDVVAAEDGAQLVLVPSGEFE